MSNIEFQILNIEYRKKLGNSQFCNQYRQPIKIERNLSVRPPEAVGPILSDQYQKCNSDIDYHQTINYQKMNIYPQLSIYITTVYLDTLCLFSVIKNL